MSESQPLPAPPPWWRRPIGMGLVGLALMVGGWKLSTFVPMTLHEREQAEKLAEVRRMSEDEQHKRRLDEIARNLQQPPYEIAGRLTVLVGLVLFIAAGVRMYQTPAQHPEGEIATPP